MKASILVIRFSAIGDVALSIPVLKNVITQNRDIEIYMLTKKNHEVFFRNIPSVHVIVYDDVNHSGIIGLYRFWKQYIRHLPITHIADLHNVIRSKLILFFYFFSTIKKAVIEKDRKEKNNAIANKTIQSKVLKHSAERYADVFRNLGFSCALQDRSETIMVSPKTKYNIGFAPFSKHNTKNISASKIAAILEALQKDIRFQIYLLCAPSERNAIQNYCNNQVQFFTSNSTFEEEFLQLNQLDFILCTDSANMHMASLHKIPTLTIWGGTHPNMGFSSYYTTNTNFMHDIACRPCSIYGSNTCPLQHYNCMNQIDVNALMANVYQRLSISA